MIPVDHQKWREEHKDEIEENVRRIKAALPEMKWDEIRQYGSDLRLRLRATQPLQYEAASGRFIEAYYHGAQSQAALDTDDVIALKDAAATMETGINNIATDFVGAAEGLKRFVSDPVEVEKRSKRVLQPLLESQFRKDLMAGISEGESREEAVRRGAVRSTVMGVAR